MRVRDLLGSQNVLVHAAVLSAADALGLLVELQEASGVITNGTAYYNAVFERETAGGSTAIGEGMALPHAANAGAAACGVAALTLRPGVEWGAPDAVPVDLVFMVTTPPDRDSERLQILARLVNLLSEPGLPEALRRARTPEEFVERLSGAEAERFA